MDETSCEKAQIEEKSEIRKLSSKVEELRNILQTFDIDFDNLHSEVFKESRKDKTSEEKEGLPLNKITELIGRVQGCINVQKDIQQTFNDFNNLLS